MGESNSLRLLSVLLTLELLSLSNGTVSSVKAECPIKITPERMVVQYKNETRTAKCKPMFSTNNAKVSWGSKTSSDSWNVNTTEDWNASPVCTATFDGLGTCNKSLNFTFYRTPEGIFIHQHNLSSMVVGRMLQLQCDIINVAPAQNLAVRWYQGNDTIRSIDSGSLRVTGCRPENSSNCDIGKVKYPVTVSSTISVLLDRRDNGTQFRCEAVLDLGPEGPQPPPTLISSPVDITVSYKPIINTTKLPRIIPVFRGYPEELVCEADGHPPPKIQWFHSSGKLLQRPSVAPSANTLSVSEAGMYNCSATNEVGSIYHVVEVILKEDYLPLIAGFVAVTVVAISVIFLFIYSIYYKNTRMRRYSLKNPKPSTPNGNVAHNGWDQQLAMTRLS